MPLPPLAAQRKIAAVLSAYDDLIENNTRRIAILEEVAQAVYREWFVNFRFPGHKKAKFVDSPLGKIPEGWQVKVVTEAVAINPKTHVPKEGEKPFVAMDALSIHSMVVRPSEMRTGNSGAKFKNGDTLFARITPCHENGKTGFVQFIGSDTDVAFGSTEFIVLRSQTLSPEFVYLLARSEDFRGNAIKSMSGATGRQRVQEACFEKFLIAHADQETINAFSQCVSPLFKSVHVLDIKNANLRKTRDLLLPKLISGQVCVERLDIAVDEPSDGDDGAEEAEPPHARTRDSPPKHRRQSPSSSRNDNHASGNHYLDTADVMAAFRQACRGRGVLERDELLKNASLLLGYKRLSPAMSETLRGHLRAAIRRRVVGVDNGSVRQDTSTMGDYARDELVAVLCSVMRGGAVHEREAVVAAVARHLGFRRLTDNVRQPVRSAINAAIRRGLLGHQGTTLWLEQSR
jgi:hypothetical protein